ncbi:hypothetical protein ACFQVA_36760 [Actinomadura keratinilytica]
MQHKEDLSDKVKQLVDRAADPVVTPVPVEGAAACADAPKIEPGLYTDRQPLGTHRWYRVDVLPGQELRASVSVAADRPLADDYGVLLRAVTAHGRELVRGSEAGSGRTDVISSGLRHPERERRTPTPTSRPRPRSAWRSATPSPRPPPRPPTPRRRVCRWS